MSLATFIDSRICFTILKTTNKLNSNSEEFLLLIFGSLTFFVIYFLLTKFLNVNKFKIYQKKIQLSKKLSNISSNSRICDEVIKLISGILLIPSPTFTLIACKLIFAAANGPWSLLLTHSIARFLARPASPRYKFHFSIFIKTFSAIIFSKSLISI